MGQQELENLQRSNEELKQSLKTKTISLHKSQQMYDDVKKRLLQTDVQHAAADAVEDTLAAVTLDVYEESRSMFTRDIRQSSQNHFDQPGHHRGVDTQRRGSGDAARLMNTDARMLFGQNRRGIIYQ